MLQFGLLDSGVGPLCMCGCGLYGSLRVLVSSNRVSVLNELIWWGIRDRVNLNACCSGSWASRLIPEMETYFPLLYHSISNFSPQILHSCQSFDIGSSRPRIVLRRIMPRLPPHCLVHKQEQALIIPRRKCLINLRRRMNMRLDTYSHNQNKLGMCGMFLTE